MTISESHSLYLDVLSLSGDRKKTDVELQIRSIYSQLSVEAPDVLSEAVRRSTSPTVWSRVKRLLKDETADII